MVAQLPIYFLPQIEDMRSLSKLAACMTMAHSQAQLSSLECHIKLLKAESTEENRRLRLFKLLEKSGTEQQDA